MKRIAVIAILTVQCISGAQAQTFLDRLKKPTKDKAADFKGIIDAWKK